MIVITGANGSIGKALHAALPDARGMDIEDWDITKPRPAANEVDPYPNVSTVFHLAASKDAPEGETDPQKVMRVNALGTANVLARWPDARVILASTCKACDPETAYGASKLIAERMVLNAGGSVARFHNVRETSGNVFRQWEALPPEASIPVTACHRYFIGIDEAVALLLAVAALPPGRYMTDPGPSKFMFDVARETYPDRNIDLIERRRGDRKREPLHATHEGLDYAQGTDWDTTNGIWRVTSPHD